MSFSGNPQQQAAFVAHLQQQQAAHGRPPLTPHQIQQMTAAMHLRQQQQQQQAQQQQQQAQQQQQQQQQPQQQAQALAQAAAPAGIQSRERSLGDGDADRTRAVRTQAALSARKRPTDRSLPRSFKLRSGDLDAPPGPTDAKLATSLDSLDSLGTAYARLQQVDRAVDWTLARKAHEVHEQAAGSALGRGQPFKRAMRVHVVAIVHDQPWQLSPEQLAAEADPAAQNGASAPDDSSSAKVPRVDVRISGELLEDPRYPSETTPFTTFLERLVVETPNRDPATYPTAYQPLTWSRPADPPAPASASPAPSASASASASLPPAISASFPTSTALALRLALYLHHPSGDRFALHPELAAVLDCAESDRVGVLEALWAYAKNRGLVVEQSEGGGGGGGAAPAAGPKGAGAQTGALKSGIKTDERTAKFFGNMGMVAFHHVPEYLNRWLMPPAPRLINLVIPVDPSAPSSQHLAYDLDVYVPDPSRPALEACARSLAALSAIPPVAGLSDPDAATVAAAQAALAEVQALDESMAVNALAVTSHLRQLHALAAFTRDPKGFLQRFVDSQAGSLAQILASNAAGQVGGSSSAAAATAAGGMEPVLGARWRDEVRRSENWEGKEWVEDAVAVWGMREREGEANRLRGVAQQQQQQQYARAR